MATPRGYALDDHFGIILPRDFFYRTIDQSGVDQFRIGEGLACRQKTVKSVALSTHDESLQSQRSIRR